MTDIFYQIIEKLPEMQHIELTDDQKRAVEQFMTFYQADAGKDTFVMTGSAGTGKTLLISLFSTFFKKMGWKTILLAPTGRAAKVISKRSRKAAYTIHHHVFSVEEGLGSSPFFSVKNNKEAAKVVYIIDESSMIGDQKEESLRAGLLENLLHYVFQDDVPRKLIFVGDPVQLPPISNDFSPALDPQYLEREYGLNVYFSHLAEVKRQAYDSLVLENAVLIRDAYLNGEENPVLELQYGRDVQTMDNAYDALETYSGYFESGNLDRVLFLCYSNNKAMQINLAIRQKIMDMETQEVLVAGDLIMVVRNNYTWGTEFFPFLANGEMGAVIEIYPETYEEKYGLKWMNVLIGFENNVGEMKEIECKVVLDLLQSKLGQLSPEQMYKVWQERQSFYLEMTKQEATKGIAKDPYINALQIKYGYCITGHKSQGGQWQNVIIAFEPNYGGDIHQYIRWTYTVFTRAEQRVFMLGCPF